MSPAVEAWSLNHWTTREVPWSSFSFRPRSLAEIWVITGGGSIFGSREVEGHLQYSPHSSFRHLLCRRCCAERFTFVIVLNLCNSVQQVMLLSSFYAWGIWSAGRWASQMFSSGSGSPQKFCPSVRAYRWVCGGWEGIPGTGRLGAHSPLMTPREAQALIIDASVAWWTDWPQASLCSL